MNRRMIRGSKELRKCLRGRYLSSGSGRVDRYYVTVGNKITKSFVYRSELEEIEEGVISCPDPAFPIMGIKSDKSFAKYRNSKGKRIKTSVVKLRVAKNRYIIVNEYDYYVEVFYFDGKKQL